MDITPITIVTTAICVRKTGAILGAITDDTGVGRKMEKHGDMTGVEIAATIEAMIVTTTVVMIATIEVMVATDINVLHFLNHLILR
jgi:hypothetical protein